MFTVRVAARVRPEGRERFIAQLQREQAEVPTRFEGCERFAIYVDPADLGSVLVYEEWRSRRQFDTYRTSEYFSQSGAVLFPLMDGAPDSAYYVSERVGP